MHRRIHRFSSHDIEQLQDVIGNVLGWPVRMSPNASSDFYGSLRIQSSDEFSVVAAEYNQALRATADENHNKLCVFLVSDGFASVERHSEAPAKADDIMLLNARNVNQMHFFGKTKTTWFTVDHEYISRFAYRYSGTHFGFSPFSEQMLNRTCEIGRAVADGFRLLDRLFSLDGAERISEYSFAAMREASLSVLCEYLARQAPDCRVDRSHASTVQMHRIIDYIVSSERPVLVSEVADHVGISIRALQLSFLREQGVSPHVFIKRARLSALRDSLAEVGSDHLAETAAYWGFTNRSRLRKDFVELFGEAEWRRVAGGCDGGA